MRSMFKVVGLCAGLLCTVTAGSMAQADEPRVVGWIEKGLILPEYTAVKIKVDSGALTSSMSGVRHTTELIRGSASPPSR